MWRNEKPGPGRYREFVQCDADTVGSARPEADAEIIAMAVEGYAAAGLPRAAYALKINNRKLLNGLLTAAGVEREGQKLAVLRAVDKLDRLGLEGVKLLLGAGRQGRVRRLHPRARSFRARRSTRCWRSSPPARARAPRRWTGSPT